MKMTLGSPVVVAVSEIGEKRWGYCQFPRVSALPGQPQGRLLLTYNLCGDDDLEYGKPGPAWVSDDFGRTWQPYDPTAPGADPMLAVSHSPISELAGGDRLCVPMQEAHRPEELPEELRSRPLQRFFCYGWRSLFRLSDCPDWVQAYFSILEGVRWSAKEERWSKTAVKWDTKDMIIRLAEQNSWSRTSLEQRVLRLGDELLYADWKSHYLMPDGSVPKSLQTICTVSTDSGRSFQRRSVIAADPSGNDILAEATLAPTADGDLICVMRRADHQQKPMAITRSTDAGHTWEPFQSFQGFGVLPQLRLLGNGTLVLSFGRPGVWLSVSPDGGRNWMDPIPVIEGDPGSVAAHSCGYTDMAVLDDQTLLLAYSDFCHVDRAGEVRKAICVRPVQVRRR